MENIILAGIEKLSINFYKWKESTLTVLPVLEFITIVLMLIYYGEDVTEEDAEAFCEKARKEFTSCEFECQNGGQPIYYYMISVE